MPAPVVANATDRGDTRYDTSGLQWDSGRGAYVDDQGWHYDSNGLSLDRPNAFDPSKPYQNQFNEQTGQYDSGGGGGGGGGGDLTASPYYQQYQSQIEAANAADLSNTKSQLQQLLIQFGLVPEGFSDKYGALDDAVKQLIQQNTDTGVSQYARLMQAKEDARKQALNNLTARGLGHSGAKGYSLRRGTLTFNQNLSDALNAVLGNANQLQTGYASRSMDRTNSLSQFLAQLAAQWRPTFSSFAPPSPPSLPPSQPMPPQQQYTAPGFEHLGVGVPNSGGYAIQTGGGYYTNPQTGDLTSKWQKLAGL